MFFKFTIEISDGLKLFDRDVDELDRFILCLSYDFLFSALHWKYHQLIYLSLFLRDTKYVQWKSIFINDFLQIKIDKLIRTIVIIL